jgi:hypothetical protein
MHMSPYQQLLHVDYCCMLRRTSNREVIELKEGLLGAASTSKAVGGSAITLRRTHGILMAVNFVGIFPLGALAARQLRCHWLRSPAVRASLFYVHVFTQVCSGMVQTSGASKVQDGRASVCLSVD